jgi:hypothetical protein
MANNLALIDLITPYVLHGENIGAQHAALSVLRLVSYETSRDDFGVAVRGRCEFHGYAKINPLQGGFQINACVDEDADSFDPGRRSPIFDIRETAVEFELFIPRAGSAVISSRRKTHRPFRCRQHGGE